MGMKIKLILSIFLLTGFSAFSQDIPRANCNDCWNPDSLGNHRAVVEVSSIGKIAKVIIPWRRRDYHPDLKRIIVEDAKTHAKVLNVKAFVLDRQQKLRSLRRK